MGSSTSGSRTRASGAPPTAAQMATGAGGEERDSTRLVRLLLGELQEVLRLLASSPVEEFRLEHDGQRIALRRQWPPPAAVPAPAAAAAAQSPAEPQPKARVDVAAQLVGVFHRSREPGGPNLVELGARVESGQAIGVIETLGMASTVEAPAAGTVVELLVEDGQPVEYGQVLARIAPE